MLPDFSPRVEVVGRCEQTVRASPAFAPAPASHVASGIESMLRSEHVNPVFVRKPDQHRHVGNSSDVHFERLDLSNRVTADRMAGRGTGISDLALPTFVSANSLTDHNAINFSNESLDSPLAILEQDLQQLPARRPVTPAASHLLFDGMASLLIVIKSKLGGLRSF
ncbi:hypothetical protein DENSPDRAFT_885983 [Dentipellis sp. KUC8613]|nr:hypothetical protein DENSPDRAFT_885983 [Dentipellis sp. KUC8613]